MLVHSIRPASATCKAYLQSHSACVEMATRSLTILVTAVRDTPNFSAAAPCEPP
ncbi:hypothetical protein Plhal304r1_c001g0002231 [Plasmopara halstedii]